MGQVFRTLTTIVNIREYPSFPYDLYRYFTLLENLKEENKLSFDVYEGDIQPATFALSYDRFNEYSFSEFQGTFQSRQMKAKLKFIDDEASKDAQAVIAQVKLWPFNSQPNMKSFINKNSKAVQLYIRDIRTMVCAIFVFLWLRPHKKDKIRILKLLNEKMQQQIPKKQEEKKDEGGPQVEILGRENEKGEFYIGTKTKSKTTWAKCLNKTIPQLKVYLNRENIPIKTSSRKSLCILLKNHLQNNPNRWIL